MKNVWVDRDQDNNITAVYANKQHDSQEMLNEDDQEVIVFTARKSNVDSNMKTILEKVIKKSANKHDLRTFRAFLAQQYLD